MYQAVHRRRFSPAFRNAARLRRALAAPEWLRSAAFTLAGIPSVGKMLVRGTRAKAA
jgi:hypothetical protein